MTSRSGQGDSRRPSGEGRQARREVVLPPNARLAFSWHRRARRRLARPHAPTGEQAAHEHRRCDRAGGRASRPAFGAVATATATRKSGGVWRELVSAVAPGIRFRDGAPPATLEDAERMLGNPLPTDLRAMLSETDGMEDQEGWTVLLWPVSQLVLENLEHRGPDWQSVDDGPWTHRLCFAATGSGEDFILDLDQDDGQVYVWNYVEGCAYFVAPTLAEFWTGWLSGTLAAEW
jgi:hypothetical protein